MEGEDSQSSFVGDEAKTQSGEKVVNFSPALLRHVTDIRAGKIDAKPTSARLREYVEQEHDAIKCIGHLANDDLWIGEGERKSADTFFLTISYVWKKASDFFEEYDPERPISEERAKWNAVYFGDQLNYLRHNFSLERLCHIVMVYDYLYCKEMKQEMKTPSMPSSRHIVPAGGKITRSKTVSQKRVASAQVSDTRMLRAIAVVFVAFFILLIVVGVMRWCNNARKTPGPSKVETVKKLPNGVDELEDSDDVIAIKRAPAPAVSE